MWETKIYTHRKSGKIKFLYILIFIIIIIIFIIINVIIWEGYSEKQTTLDQHYVQNTRYGFKENWWKLYTA